MTRGLCDRARQVRFNYWDDFGEIGLVGLKQGSLDRSVRIQPLSRRLMHTRGGLLDLAHGGIL